jgi:hypothetical protein
MKFEFAVQKLTEAKVSCHLKETEHELVIELGFGWPEELAEVIHRVLPDFEGSICAESSGAKVLNRKNICGGPKTYSYLSRFY